MKPVNIAVVIPTLNRRDSLSKTLESLERQTQRTELHVVDNASTDGTAEMIRARFPTVSVLRNDMNLGFGRAINHVALAIDCDILVLVNNDVVCDAHFVERICEPFTESDIGMVAGVLTQAGAPNRIDSAGVELDETLGAWDYLWNHPVEVVASSSPPRPPIGPCGGAAAYRMRMFRELGGFDENLFAYWEDVDLAIRFRQTGCQCALAPGALALHEHGQTLGPSPAQRELHAFGRGYVLGKYGVLRGLRMRLAVGLLDWPTLLVHLVVRRESNPIRERSRGLRVGRQAKFSSQAPPPTTVSAREALTRQFDFLRLRLRRRLPGHFYRSAGQDSVNS